MDKDTKSPWKMPAPEELPGTDATLERIIRFAQSVDPVTHFRDRWGEEYKTNVRALWERSIESFKAGTAMPAPPDEMLMCLAYDVALGPYLGVPNPHKLPFLRWLLDGVRKSL
jgi:hypothetical protein